MVKQVSCLLLSLSGKQNSISTFEPLKIEFFVFFCFLFFIFSSHSKFQNCLKTLNDQRSSKWLLFSSVFSQNFIFQLYLFVQSFCIKETGPKCSFTVPYCSVSDGSGPGRMESALSTLSLTKSSHFIQETWTKRFQQLVHGEDKVGLLGSLEREVRI